MSEQWLDQVKTVEGVLETMPIDIAERIRKFGRNWYTNEVQYLSAETLRTEYLEICEKLIVYAGGEGATKVLEELVKPSYFYLKSKFQNAEV